MFPAFFQIVGVKIYESQKPLTAECLSCNDLQSLGSKFFTEVGVTRGNILEYTEIISILGEVVFYLFIKHSDAISPNNLASIDSI